MCVNAEEVVNIMAKNLFRLMILKIKPLDNK
jgi:hypothetical protein